MQTIYYATLFLFCGLQKKVAKYIKTKKGSSPAAVRFITETSDHKEDDDDFFNGGRLLEDAFGHPFFSICSNCFVCTKVFIEFC